MTVAVVFPAAAAEGMIFQRRPPLCDDTADDTAGCADGLGRLGPRVDRDPVRVHEAFAALHGERGP
ncbi:hypothetical protein OIE69_11040 [Actinacidiphila glaucinigra]|uniref:hypothetical protein n=1 Tax=Actinacidiphila glaucinigra TaxID=235986 RepID=UPI002DD9BDE9|nr:hypothetical protein [Actinacidiphila glaucinigra]WSD59415.1 hypothetical protein OIE69_11040 [Actinacidiphila glaucinigra]